MSAAVAVAVEGDGAAGGARTVVGVRALSKLFALMGVLTALACGSKQGAQLECRDDRECGGNLCMMGTCVPRGTQHTFAVEILPRPDSPAARTGIARVALGPDKIQLAADDSVMVEGTVTNAPDAHVVLLVANPIPGQGDLQFETDLTNFKFQLAVGSRLIRSIATIWLIPNEATRDQPPVPFAAMLDSTLSFTFPPKSQMKTISGALHDDADRPAPDFVVRAFAGTRVVSNVVTTSADGSFELAIAPGSVPADGDQSVMLDFTPADVDSGPRFLTASLSLATASAAGAPSRTFHLPSSQAPVPMQFAVQGPDSKGGQALGDVTMRFRTEIPSGADGVAIWEREGHSDDFGEINIILVPGTAAAPRTYQVNIVPPTGSPYAARCVAAQQVNLGGTGRASPYADTFVLESKVTLQGTVFGHDATVVSSASVMATPLSVESGCANGAFVSPVSSTTSRTGAYQMLVDPGTYRLDIDPPMGSAVPRLTEELDGAVVVGADAATTIHDVNLPDGEAIEGEVTGPDDMALGSASIRLFEIRCDGESCSGPARIAPVLRAQARTDMYGGFRAVLPLL